MTDLRQRLEEKFEKRDCGYATPCWHWIGALNHQGYAILKVPGENKHARAHRVSYEIFVGRIPDGLEPDHLCRNRACINPDHLEPVTHQENIKRGLAVKTLCPKGHPYSDGNLITTSQGWRKCRECARAANRAYNAKRLIRRLAELEDVL